MSISLSLSLFLYTYIYIYYIYIHIFIFIFICVCIYIRFFFYLYICVHYVITCAWGGGLWVHSLYGFGLRFHGLLKGPHMYLSHLAEELYSLLPSSPTFARSDCSLVATPRHSKSTTPSASDPKK